MYANVKSLVKRFAGEKDGATMLEYGILAGLIAVVSIGVIATIGQDILSAFQAIEKELP